MVKVSGNDHLNDDTERQTAMMQCNGKAMVFWNNDHVNVNNIFVYVFLICLNI